MRYFVLGIVSACALLLAFPAAAGGGFGSVWVVSTTADSITIDWSVPSGKLRNASNPAQHEICYKESGDWIGSCADGEVIRTSSRPFTLNGLNANELYKIKVFTYTEKRNLRGKWVNPEYRKVATLTQATRPAPAGTALSGNLEVAGATAGSLTVRANLSHSLGVERIVVCYKKTWSITIDEESSEVFNLDPSCTQWPSTPTSGSGVITGPLSLSNQLTIGGLDPCRQYELAAFAFPLGGPSVRLGDAVMGHTSGRCWFSLVSGLLDFDDSLATDYVDQVEAFYGESLADHIVDRNPHLRNEHLILERTGENVSEPLILLEYLAEARPEVVAAWQEEEGLGQAGLAVDQFLAVHEPELLRVLEEDLAAEDVLALAGDRFEVYVTWETPQGDDGAGQPVPLTRDTGYFWFFQEDNVELVVKVLDACVPPFDRFWVFAAGLTDVAVEVTVVDTETGATFELSNPQGQPFLPVQATDAFATCP